MEQVKQWSSFNGDTKGNIRVIYVGTTRIVDFVANSGGR